MLLSRAGTDFARFYHLVRNDIFRWCRAFNFRPTWQQEELFHDAQELVAHGKPTHIAVKSGQGPGKTAAAALLALWRTFRSFPALTVVTAPTMRQCKEVFLAECRQRVQQAAPEIKKFFEVRATEIEILGVEDWGIKLASATKAENMQGWHNPYLSFVVDEASGVAKPIIEAIVGTLTNRDKLLLMIGNPNTRDSPFFDCFHRDRHRWRCHTWNAEESPNVDKENIQRLEEIYGRQSDVFRVRVLGEFPDQDPNCVMSSDDLEVCAKNNMLECARQRLENGAQKAFGMDFARYGDDASVLYQRSGLAIVDRWQQYKAEPDRVIARGFQMQNESGWRDQDCLFVVDADGMGQGLMHHFYNRGKRVFPFHFGGSSTSPEYDDTVTEAFFNLGKLVKERKIYIPDDPELIQQLSTRQYYLTLKGKIKCESKDDWRDRLQIGSPDKADAAVMAFYNGTVTQARVAGSRERR